MNWYDIRNNKNKWRVFNLFLGGRGIGKTYSAIDYVVNAGKQFLYIRSTEKQIQLSLTPDRGNPFKKWASDHNRNIFIRRGEDINDIVETSEGDGKESESILGYAAALSTFENLRGVDFSSIDLILYDEFIQTRPFAFDAFRAFLNLYESVNRNRELSGDDPVQVIFLANTQELNNPILAGFDLIGAIENLKRHNQQRFSRGDIYVELCDSEVSGAKAKSVLYRNLPETDEYKREALRNEFSRNDFSMIGRPKNLIEYKPICRIDEIGIYAHKSQRKYYCSVSAPNKVPAFNSKNQRGLFFRHYGSALMDAYACNSLLSDSFLTRQKILEIINII